MVIPRSWFGGGERAGFHTCTQLEDLILALLPQDQVHKSHCCNSDGHLLAPVFPAGPAASDRTPGPAEPAKDAVGKAPREPQFRRGAEHRWGTEPVRREASGGGRGPTWVAVGEENICSA